MMFSDKTDDRRLGPLVAHGLGKAHLLTDLKLVESPLFNTIAMEVDLAAVRGGDEAVISTGRKHNDATVPRRLVLLDVTLSLACQILQLTARSLECIACLTDHNIK